MHGIDGIDPTLSELASSKTPEPRGSGAGFGLIEGTDKLWHHNNWRSCEESRQTPGYMASILSE